MVPLCINGTWVSVVMSDKIPCLDNLPIYCKQKSGALWQVMMEKALAKYHGGYNKIQEFPLGSNQTSLTPYQVMMELTGLPSCEYELGQWEKLKSNFKDLEDILLHDEWDVKRILCTWNENHSYKASSKFPKKCIHGDDFKQLMDHGFPVGCHILSKVVHYTKEDESPGKMCLIKAPNGCGNEFRENGWNKERYPSVTPEQWDQLTPLFQDYNDRYFMDWDDALGFFETMHCTFNY